MSFRFVCFVQLTSIIRIMNNYFCAVRLNIHSWLTVAVSAFYNVCFEIICRLNVPNLRFHKIISGRCPIFLLSLYATGLIDPLKWVDGRDSNPQQCEPHSHALPIELPPNLIIIRQPRYAVICHRKEQRQCYYSSPSHSSFLPRLAVE